MHVEASRGEAKRCAHPGGCWWRGRSGEGWPESEKRKKPGVDDDFRGRRNAGLGVSGSMKTTMTTRRSARLRSAAQVASTEFMAAVRASAGVCSR
jgi:hypothetical protein